jgi:hypothetical protein
VTSNGYALQHADAVLKFDRTFVLAAVRIQGATLAHAEEFLKSNRDIVLAAVKSTGGALRHATAELKRDREIVLAAVSTAGEALEFIDVSLWSDREIVLKAVQKDGHALKFASASMRADREIVKNAVQQTWRALTYAHMGADEELCRIATSQWPIKEYAPELDTIIERGCPFMQGLTGVNMHIHSWGAPVWRILRELENTSIANNGNARFKMMYGTDENKSTEIMRSDMVPYPLRSIHITLCDYVSNTKSRRWPPAPILVASAR